MQTFDQSLFDLFEAGEITYEDALRNADSVNDLRLQYQTRRQSIQRRRSQDRFRSPADCRLKTWS